MNQTKKIVGSATIIMVSIAEAKPEQKVEQKKVTTKTTTTATPAKTPTKKVSKKTIKKTTKKTTKKTVKPHEYSYRTVIVVPSAETTMKLVADNPSFGVGEQELSCTTFQEPPATLIKTNAPIASDTIVSLSKKYKTRIVAIVVNKKATYCSATFTNNGTISNHMYFTGKAASDFRDTLWEL